VLKRLGGFGMCGGDLAFQRFDLLGQLVSLILILWP
jgi:hypothetical protein